MNISRSFRGMTTSLVYKLSDLTEYTKNGIESRAVVQKENYSLTLFSFDKGEEVSAYSIPGDSIITVIEGTLRVIYNNSRELILKDGDSIAIQANINYSYDATDNSKIMIQIIKKG